MAGRRVHRALLLAGAGLVALLVLAPLLALGQLASRGSGRLWPHLIRYVLPDAVIETALLLAGVGLTAAVIGTGTAWLAASFRFPGRAWLQWALLLPLAMPGYIAAYAYLDVLHPLGPVQLALGALLGQVRLPWFPDVRTLPGCAVLLGLVLYPYVYLSARAAFLMESAAALDAARTLGASGTALFLRVAVPLAWPAIAAGLGLALMETLADLGTVELFGVTTLTRSIYTTWVTRSSPEGAAQVALVLLALVAALLWMERLVRRGRGRGSVGRRTLRRRLGPVARWTAALACVAPVLAGFGVPALHLAVVAARRAAEFGPPAGLIGWAANSLTLAAVATSLALVAGVLLALAARVAGGGWLLRLGVMGYAAPGAVVALGMLPAFAAFDRAMSRILHAGFGFQNGLLLSGSAAALVLAYLVRFVAIPAGAAESGYAKLPRALDDAAAVLHAELPALVAQVHLPLLRPALAAAAILLFVDVMKELPATLLLRPLNTETLATAVFSEAARGTYEDGAMAALLIVALGLLPVALLARIGGEDSCDGSG